MTEWEMLLLGDLAADQASAFATGPFGSDVSAKNFRSSGVPMIRGTNLSDDVSLRLAESDMVFVSPDLASRHKRSVARRGDLVFTCWGTIGQVGFLGEETRYPEYLVSNKQMKMTPDRRRVSPLFLYYYLSQPSMVRYVREHAIGSSVPGFNLRQLKSLPVCLPSKYDQTAIAEVLGTLDGKIAANDRALRILHDLAYAIVCEPVTCLDTSLSEMSSMIVRGVVPRYVEDDGLMVLNQRCIRDHQVDISQARLTSPSVKTDRKMLHPSDLLVNSTGQGTLGRVARWTVQGVEATADSHITIVRFDPECVDADFVGVRALGLEEQMVGLAQGSTGQTELKRELLGTITVGLPSLVVQRRVGERIRAFDSLSEAYRAENLRLAQARDELLPLLMSGRIRVKDAGRTMEEVL